MGYTFLGTSTDSGNRLTTGEENYGRELAQNTGTGPGSGQLRLSFFTARKSETITQVRMYTGGQAAAATPTLCRMGIWSIAANGDGTLIASTANDTALFNATTSAFTRTFTAPFNKVAGQRYAVAPLIVSGAAAPTFLCHVIGSSAEALIAPALSAAITSLTDLPVNFTGASLVGSGHRYYAALLP